jgi:mediator of RNA polymerase II transcription subunit 31
MTADVSMSDPVSTNDDNKTTSATLMSSESAAPATNVNANVNVNLPSNRFELELEFLQCLASPAYLHHLATTGILNDTKFLAFLKYLQGYWMRPEYARFVTYPNAFYFLDLCLTNERFRREMANVGFRNFVHEQQFYAWQHRSKQLYGTGLLDSNNTNNNAATASNNASNQNQKEKAAAAADGTNSSESGDSDDDKSSSGNNANLAKSSSFEAGEI